MKGNKKNRTKHKIVKSDEVSKKLLVKAYRGYAIALGKS